MPTIKTQDLICPALDWVVSDIEFKRCIAEGEYIKQWVLEAHKQGSHTSPWSTDWLFGGPIIEREGISIVRCIGGWKAMQDHDVREWLGETPLQAAMRCHVAARLGPTVDVPQELLP